MRLIYSTNSRRPDGTIWSTISKSGQCSLSTLLIRWIRCFSNRKQAVTVLGMNWHAGSPLGNAGSATLAFAAGDRLERISYPEALDRDLPVQHQHSLWQATGKASQAREYIMFHAGFHGYSSCLIELMRLIYSTNSRRPDGTIWSTISKSGQCSLSTLLIGWIRCFSNRKQAVTVLGMNWHAGSPLGNAGSATLAFAAGDRLERISYPEALDRDLPVQHQHSLWQATGKASQAREYIMFHAGFHGYSSCLIELMRLIYSTNSRRPDGTIWSTISKSGQCSLSTRLIRWIRCFSNRKQAVTVLGMNWHAGSPLGNAGSATLAFAAGDRLERISYPEALDRDLPVQHQHSLWQATGKASQAREYIMFHAGFHGYSSCLIELMRLIYSTNSRRPDGTIWSTISKSGQCSLSTLLIRWIRCFSNRKQAVTVLGMNWHAGSPLGNAGGATLAFAAGDRLERISYPEALDRDLPVQHQHSLWQATGKASQAREYIMFHAGFHGYSSCLIELMRLIYSTNSRRPDGTIWSTISKSGQCSLSTLLIRWIRCFSNRKQAVTVLGMNWHAGSPLGNAGSATLAFAAGDRLERISYPEALDRDLPVQHQHSLWQATGKASQAREYIMFHAGFHGYSSCLIELMRLIYSTNSRRPDRIIAILMGMIQWSMTTRYSAKSHHSLFQSSFQSIHTFMCIYI